MRRRQVYAEIEHRKAEGQAAFLAGALDQVTAFDPANYRMTVEATPSIPAPSLPKGEVPPILRRRQLLPLQGDGPEGDIERRQTAPAIVSVAAPLVATLRDGAPGGEAVPLTKTGSFTMSPRASGFCDLCNKQLGRGLNFHRMRCRG